MNDHSGLTAQQSDARAGATIGRANGDSATHAADPLDAAKASDRESELAQFRQLLFGDELRDYEHRLQRLEASQAQALERLRSEQQARFEQIDSLLRAELARLSRAQRRDREERGIASQQLSDRLDALAEGLGQSLGARIDAFRGEFVGASKEREAALTAQAEELRARFDLRAQELEAELRQARDRLSQVQADRDELARLFGEVSRRLNGQLELPPP